MSNIRFVNLYTDQWGSINADVVYEKTTHRKRGTLRMYCDLGSIRDLPKTVQEFMENTSHIKVHYDDILKQYNHYYTRG